MQILTDSIDIKQCEILLRTYGMLITLVERRIIYEENFVLFNYKNNNCIADCDRHIFDSL